MAVRAQEVRLSELRADTTARYRIEMSSGSVISGCVVMAGPETIAVESKGIGRIELAKADIVKVITLDARYQRNGRFWYPNPHATRYLIGPSAIPLRKGEGYYQNTYILLNSVAYGITNHVSITGGFELTSTFGRESPGPIWYLSARGGGEVTKRVHIGAMATYLSVPNWFSDDDDSDRRNGLGAISGVVTYGTTEALVTAGTGWGYSASGLSDRPVLSLGGLVRVTRGIALISENWIIPDNQESIGIYSYGLRFMGERSAFDLAFINNRSISNEIAIGVPFVDFVLKF